MDLRRSDWKTRPHHRPQPLEVSLAQRSHLLRLPPGPRPLPPHRSPDFRRGQCSLVRVFDIECRRRLRERNERICQTNGQRLLRRCRFRGQHDLVQLGTWYRWRSRPRLSRPQKRIPLSLDGVLIQNLVLYGLRRVFCRAES